jgi:acyl-CoA oxidase
VEAIGYRMAYHDAAVSAGIPQCLIDLYVVSIMKLDSSWCSEIGGVRRSEQFEMEDKAVSEVERRLEEFIQGFGAEPYATAPIISEGMWQDFVANLSVYDSSSDSAPAQDVGPLVNFCHLPL